MFKYFGFSFLLLLVLFANAQPIDYTFSFKGIGDNREYFSGYNQPQTILGARGALILGTRIDSIHRVKAGIDYFFEFGGELGELKPDFVLYYEAIKGPWMFRMGSFPRADVLNFPLAIVADDYTYYKPNLEGLFVQYKGKNWQMNTFADWVSRQDSVRREQFMAGFTGRSQWRRFFVEDYWYMFHNAGTMIRDSNRPIEDYNGGLIMTGIDLSGIIPIDKVIIKTGLLNSMKRIRTPGSKYTISYSSYTEIQLEYKGYGVQTIFNFGDPHNFFLGDSFYNNTNSYIRSNIYFTPINFEHVKGRFTWSLHIANGDLDNQQQFSLIYLFNR